LFAWLTLLPVTGPLPHTVHTRAISSILHVVVSERCRFGTPDGTPETPKSSQASSMRQPNRPAPDA
jgi:hypothetical protein